MRGTLLIVDYSKNLRMLYDLELSEEGYEILLADNEDGVMRMLNEVCPDLVILDGELLLSNGITLLERIRTFCDRTLIILNEASNDTCSNFLNSHLVDDCLIKSSDLDRLKWIIKEALVEKKCTRKES